jgi:uncharacterized protein (DUF2141 family)
MQTIKATFIMLWLVTATVSKGQQTLPAKKLAIKVTNIKNKNKNLYVGIYRVGDEFPTFNKYWKNTKVTTTGSESIIEFEVPFGEYAVAVSHDLNGNGSLDRNFFGYPSEPFGFSKNFKPNLSSPDFSDCMFTFSQKNNSITINLID